MYQLNKHWWSITVKWEHSKINLYTEPVEVTQWLKTSKCCMAKLCLRIFNTHVYPHQIGTRDRTKYGYHQNPSCWPNEFYWGYLWEYGWAVTYRNINYSKTVASPKPQVTGDNSHILEPGAHCTACTQFNRWEVSFLGAPFRINKAIRQLVWWPSLLYSLASLRVFFSFLKLFIYLVF